MTEVAGIKQINNLLSPTMHTDRREDAERLEALLRNRQELIEALEQNVGGMHENAFIEMMRDARCHAGITTIAGCGRCSRELGIIRAMAKAKELDNDQ